MGGAATSAGDETVGVNSGDGGVVGTPGGCRGDLLAGAVGIYISGAKLLGRACQDGRARKASVVIVLGVAKETIGTSTVSGKR